MSGFCLRVVTSKCDCDLCEESKSFAKTPVNKHQFYLQVCLACMEVFAPNFNKETIELAILSRHQPELN